MPRYQEQTKVTGEIARHRCNHKPKVIKDCKHEKTFETSKGIFCSICGEKLSCGEPTRHPIAN